MTRTNNIAMPTAAEIEKIEPIIDDAFLTAGVSHGGFHRPANGGLILQDVTPNTDEWREIEQALFAHGIVMISLGVSLAGFAVRH